MYIILVAAKVQRLDNQGLIREVVVSKMEITTHHGAIDDKTQTHSVDIYHLDAIIEEINT